MMENEIINKVAESGLININLEDCYPEGERVVFDFPAHWDPKLRIPRGQVVAAASIVSPKY